MRSKQIRLTSRALSVVLATIGLMAPLAPTAYGGELNTLTDAEKAAGWRLLFDGKTTNGWRGYKMKDMPKGWQVIDGTLTRVSGGEGGKGAGGGDDIITLEKYDSFELLVEWKIVPGGNAGILYWVSEDGVTAWHTAPEMQVLDNAKYPTRDKRQLAGACYDLYAPTKETVRPAGEWNRARIVAKGRHVEHWLNGEKIVEYELGSADWKRRVAGSKFKDKPDFAKRARGYICLQDHTSRVAYRNIKIRRLRPTGEPEAKRRTLPLELRHRAESPGRSGDSTEVHRTVEWDAAKTAVIVCDMWNDHTCKGAADRVAEMAPALNRTVKAARNKGVLVIHAPSGTMSAYTNTPQRRRAIEAPFAAAPVKIKWNHWDPKREGPPLDFLRGGGCGCMEPCSGWVADEQGSRQWKGGKRPWTRQIDTIEIAPEDAVSDNGQEIYNLMQQRGIANVILMGVHTNICVSGRPFGLRQMVYFGKNVVLCRDLTDSFFQPKSPGFSHFRGTERVVEHIEKHLCPTIASTSITGEPMFRFKNDPAGHLR